MRQLIPMLDAFDYPSAIGALDSEPRLLFYEALAHNLTVSVRAIWSNEKISDGEKVEQLKWLNEIMHRVTSKIRVLRLNRHEWTEADSWAHIKHRVSLCPSLESDVERAVRTTYAMIKHEHDGDQ
jgi:hypothetical protein